MSTPGDELLKEAIELAIQAVREGTGGPFGAIVVKDGRVIGRGQNRVLESNDPTAHAEVVAIRDASRTLGSPHLRGCVLYASCEPCPLCLAASMWARVDSIWYAASRSAAEAVGFDDSIFHDELRMPEEERSLKVQHLLVDGAGLPFEEWSRRENRRLY